MSKRVFFAVCLMVIVVSESACKAYREPNAFEINQRYISRGINFGNALEAPKEGDWGPPIKTFYFNITREAWFTSFRIPVCWSAHALDKKPYTIDPNFFKRMDWVIDEAMQREVIVIVTMHHYNELYKDPAGQKERFLAIWKQIAEHYKDIHLSVLFEPLNEPHDNLNADKWNKLLRDVLAVIRKSNPKRVVIFGPANYNDIRMLNTLELPKNDPNIIVTAHYYLPYEFTHQGAHWAADSNAWLGTKWTGTDSEKQMITKDFDDAAAWAKKNNRPIFIGEFGANSKADMDSRVRWTKFVADTAIERGFSFAYWDFCGEYFGVYDLNTMSFRKPLLEALIPPQK
ncbi:MAG: glycoside hydrolase family 5 protein [Sedimentisphaerales bacterium]